MISLAVNLEWLVIGYADPLDLQGKAKGTILIPIPIGMGQLISLVLCDFVNYDV